MNQTLEMLVRESSPDEGGCAIVALAMMGSEWDGESDYNEFQTLLEKGD